MIWADVKGTLQDLEHQSKQKKKVQEDAIAFVVEGVCI